MILHSQRAKLPRFVSTSLQLCTGACQAPLSMRFSRKEYWLGCHVLLQGIFPTQGSNPCLLHRLHRQGGSLPFGKPKKSLNTNKSASTGSPSWARATEIQSVSLRMERNRKPRSEVYLFPSSPKNNHWRSQPGPPNMELELKGQLLSLHHQGNRAGSKRSYLKH